MGCEIVVEGASAAELDRVRALFEERDATFSRFRPDSELRRVDAAAGAKTVSPLFARMVEAALRAEEATGGLVVPTLGDALEAAGYDRDFDELEPRDEPAGAAAAGAVRLYGHVLVKRGRLDLNGVVKAAAVDDALRLLSGPGWISAGGDVATNAALELELPGGGSVRLVSGGLATSGRTKRRWLRAGEEQHHLIDPRTGRPAASPWDEVTVGAATCLAADVAAKAAFLLGREGPAWLDARRLPGRFLARGGVVANESWLAQDPGVTERVAARLGPDAEAVRARADGDLRQQLPVPRVDRVDDAVPAPR